MLSMLDMLCCPGMVILGSRVALGFTRQEISRATSRICTRTFKRVVILEPPREWGSLTGRRGVANFGMHMVHIDKKGRVGTGSIVTQTSTAGSLKDHAIKEVPGIVEEGRIFFFYRPRTGLQEAHSLGDIQRFYMVMLPLSRPAPARLIVVGKKHLPEKGQRFWAAVVAVAYTMDGVLKGLGPKDRHTTGSGPSQARLTPSARLLGEGVYDLFDHGQEVDLLYELEIPLYPHEAQEELGIHKTGDYTIQMKNPYRPSPPGLGLGKKPDYPKELQQMFCEGPAGGYAWIPPRNPALLDFEGAQFVLIGRSPDIERKDKSLKELLDDAVKEDLGTELQTHEDASEEDDTMLEKLKGDVSADCYGIDV